MSDVKPIKTQLKSNQNLLKIKNSNLNIIELLIAHILEKDFEMFKLWFNGCNTTLTTWKNKKERETPHGEKIKE